MAEDERGLGTRLLHGLGGACLGAVTGLSVWFWAGDSVWQFVSYGALAGLVLGFFVGEAVFMFFMELLGRI